MTSATASGRDPVTGHVSDGRRRRGAWLVRLATLALGLLILLQALHASGILALGFAKGG